ncbi:alkaline shock response membrane anchor protein AmaP [Pelotomaculum propionicicum]|uniref:alkaline shock response membrane anchor protein AmaP n=1 Tax=Pelotomaculum propionicicum TaxID=258475 RepID=UPI003B80C30F
MNPFDRFLLAVYSLFITVLFILFSAVMLGWPAPLILLRDLFYPGRPEVFWPVMVVVILIGARLFWVSLYKPQKKSQHVVLAENALGQVNLSLSAVEDLSNKVAGKIHGVREVSSQIIEVPQGVGLKIQASVTPDINVPSASAEVQNTIKEKVFEITGLQVSSVEVHIQSISVTKPRVE